MHLGIIKHLKSLAPSKEVVWKDLIREDREGKWAPLDVLPLELNRQFTFPAQIGWKGDHVGSVVLVSNHRRVLQDPEMRSTRSKEELK